MNKDRLKFKGKIINGSFIPNEAKAYLNHKQSYEGKEVSVQINKWTKYKERSNQQNRYWHKVVCGMFSDENGDSPTYWHKYLKILLLLEEMIGRAPDMDRIIKAGKFDEIANMLTTTSLSTKEFNGIISKARAYASRDWGIDIPLPNEVPY